MAQVVHADVFGQSSRLERAHGSEVHVGGGIEAGRHSPNVNVGTTKKPRPHVEVLYLIVTFKLAMNRKYRLEVVVGVICIHLDKHS
jgi:hypothetical protein